MSRRHDLDWLKALVVLNLFLFHAAWLLVLVPGFSNVDKEQPTVLVMKLFVGFVDQWHMQLLFFISGVSIFFALGQRSPGVYVKERVKRLLIPLIFGALVILPPMFYFWPNPEAAIERSSRHFLSFYFHEFFRIFYNEGDFVWRHLWFIFYLFVYSIITLPLFLLLRKEPGGLPVSKLVTFLERKARILLLAVPLIFVQVTLTVKWPISGVGRHSIYNDLARFLFYIILFIYGYLFCSDKRFWQSIERNFKVSLPLGIACILCLFVVWSRIGGLPKASYRPGYILYAALDGFNTWCWLIVLLGLGRKCLLFSNRLLDYAREASYPVYLLHEAIMVVIGYHLVKLKLPIIIEFLVLVTVTFVVTMGSYDLIVRRVNVFRFLFGMRKKKSA